MVRGKRTGEDPVRVLDIMRMTPIKVGDRVRVTDNTLSAPNEYIGAEGTVAQMENLSHYLVDMGVPPSVPGPFDYGDRTAFWFHRGDLEKVV